MSTSGLFWSVVILLALALAVLVVWIGLRRRPRGSRCRGGRRANSPAEEASLDQDQTSASSTWNKKKPKKGKRPKKKSYASGLSWSKYIFPRRSEHASSSSTSATTTILIIDVNNVRGKSGFATGTVTDFCATIRFWVQDVMRQCRLPSARLHVLLAVDHGPRPCVMDYDSHGGNDDTNTIFHAPITAWFAGEVRTADDCIVDAVAALQQPSALKQLVGKDRNDTTQYHHCQILVVTGDRELRMRCQEAAQSSHKSPPKPFFSILASATLADWLDQGRYWEQYFDSQDHKGNAEFYRKGYETTRQREQQAQELYDELSLGARRPNESVVGMRPYKWPVIKVHDWVRRICWHQNQVSLPQAVCKDQSASILTQLMQKHTQDNQTHDARKISDMPVDATNITPKLHNLLDVPTHVKAQYVALDCELVGVGKDGAQSALARVSVVDWDLAVLLDTYVKVHHPVTDYRTTWSGIEPHHIDQNNPNAMDLEKCLSLVARLTTDKIIVGHGLIHDLRPLELLDHPKERRRDTSHYQPFKRQGAKKGWYRARRLRDLVTEFVGAPAGDSFQQGAHDSVDDARAVMQLFQVVYQDWEAELVAKKRETLPS